MALAVARRSARDVVLARPARHRRRHPLRREPAAVARGRRRVRLERAARRGCRRVRRRMGRTAGSARRVRWSEAADFQRDAHLANVHTPELHTHDRWGFRLDEVEYDPSYHRVISQAIAHGAHTSAWAEPRPGAHVARAATFMLFAQVEPGHACPVSMTHAAVSSIVDSPWVADDWHAAAPLARVRAAPDGRVEVERADRHGDDREAGRLRRPGGHDRRHVDGRPRLPAHRSQVVLLGADVGRLPRAGPYASGRDRGGPLVPVRAADAPARHAQRVPAAAAQGQARQPVERLRGGRVRRHGGLRAR